MIQKSFNDCNHSNGMVIEFSRLLDSERKRLKGIIDSIVINDDLEITKEHRRYVIRRTGSQSITHLYIEPGVSNVIYIPDHILSEKIHDVEIKNY